LLSLLVVPAAASANPNNVMSGQAYAAKVKISALSLGLTVGPDTGLISTNQTTNTSLNAGSLSSLLISGSLLNAAFSSNAKAESADNPASVATAVITIPGLPRINGDLISASSQTTCRNKGTSTGTSVGGSITVYGKTYAIAAPPNTVIPLGPLGSITLNEQTPITNGLEVNAIHVRSILGTDVVVSSASSAVSNCGKPLG
jgi:hypothetical protein